MSSLAEKCNRSSVDLAAAATFAQDHSEYCLRPSGAKALDILLHPCGTTEVVP
jgi:hypothetical protein